MVFVPLLRTPPDGEGTRDCHLPPLRAFISVLCRILEGARIFINRNHLRSVANVLSHLLRAFLIQSAHVQHLYTHIMQLSLIIEWHIYILPDPRTLLYNSCHVVKWDEMRFRRVYCCVEEAFICLLELKYKKIVANYIETDRYGSHGIRK